MRTPSGRRTAAPPGELASSRPLSAQSRNTAARITQKLRKVTLRDSIFLLEASIFLFVAACLKNLVPMRWYAPWLGEHLADTDVVPVEVDLDRLLPVVSAINRAVKYSPFRSKCLVQALCSSLMLRFNGLPSDFYLGVGKNESRGVIAHAWVKSGGYFVAGQHGHRQYAVISAFSSRPTPFSSS